jgi:Raf kinase inhibitor-like YbhB/YbcL family protein
MPSSGPITLTSTAFSDGGPNPREYTCLGENVSPALSWTGMPEGTVELILVVDDPDANGFVHWIIVASADEPGLPRAIPAATQTYRQGTNSFGRVGWSGPCPPSGTHHYRLKLTALAAATGLSGRFTDSEVRDALAKATVLGQAVLTGTYRKA